MEVLIEYKSRSATGGEKPEGIMIEAKATKRPERGLPGKSPVGAPTGSGNRVLNK
jgi:hypothetical protein